MVFFICQFLIHTIIVIKLKREKLKKKVIVVSTAKVEIAHINP